MRIVEAAGREVHGDVDVETSPVPARASRDGMPQHDVVSGWINPAALGDRDECGGGEQTVPRVFPAHQRLDAADLTAADRDLGLDVHGQLVLGDGPAQLATRASCRGCWCSSPLVQPDAAAAHLRGVHRDVGLLEQFGLAVRARLGVTAAPTDARICTSISASVTGGSSASSSRSPASTAVAASSTSGEQNGELVTAEPGHGDVRPGGRVSRAADFDSKSSPLWWPRVSLTSLNRPGP